MERSPLAKTDQQGGREASNYDGTSAIVPVSTGRSLSIKGLGFHIMRFGVNTSFPPIAQRLASPKFEEAIFRLF